MPLISAILRAIVGFISARRRQRNAFLWSAISALLPPGLVVLVQLPAKNTSTHFPRWSTWLVRIVVVLLITIVVVKLGDYLSVQSPLRRFQASVVAAATSGSRVSDSSTIIMPSGQSFQVTSAFRAAFALSALGMLAALLVFRRWLLASFVLSATGFVLGAGSQVLERIAFVSRVSIDPSALSPQYFLFAVELLLWATITVALLFGRPTTSLSPYTV
jgi:hypothetical protein